MLLRRAADAAGHAHRVIAARLGRPAAAVRGWLRRAGDRHARWLYEQAVTHAARLDADVLNQMEPASSVLGDALSALAAAVAAWRRHKLRALPAWTLVVMLTGGRLLLTSSRWSTCGLRQTSLPVVGRHRDDDRPSP